MFSLAAKEIEECSMLDRSNGHLKLGLRKYSLKLEKKNTKKKKKKKKTFSL